MTSEEITKEIDLRTDSRGKIIHVDFNGTPSPTSKPAPLAPRREWLRGLDVREPWILRLVAVVTILILSMLIL